MKGRNNNFLNRNKGQISNGLLLFITAIILILILIFAINRKLEIETQDVGQVERPQIKTEVDSRLIKPSPKNSTRSVENPQAGTVIKPLPSAMGEKPAKNNEPPKIIYEIPLDDVILDL